MGRASFAIVLALAGCQQGRPVPAPPPPSKLGVPTRLGPAIPVMSRDILGLAVTPDGATAIAVARGIEDDERAVGQHGEPGVFVWNLATGELVKKLGDTEAHAFAATPDASIVAVLDAERATVWNVADGSSHLVQVGSNVRWIGLDDHGETLSTVGLDGGVESWDVKTGAMRAALATHEKPTVAAFADGKIAYANEAGTITLLGLDGKQATITMDSKVSDPTDLAMVKDHIAIVSRSDAVLLINGKIVQRVFEGGDKIHILSDDRLAISTPNQGRELVVAGSTKVTLDGYGADSRAMVEAPRGKLVAGTWSGAIRTFDLATGTDSNLARGHTSSIQMLGFAGTTLVSSSGPFAPQRGLRWSGVTPAPDLWPALAVSPHLVATIRGDDPQLVLERAGAESITTMTPNRVDPTHTALTDHWFAGTTDDALVIYDIDHATWTTYPAPPGVQAIGISPDGSMIALGGQTIAIYNRATGALARTLVDNTLNISSLVFTPDNAKLVVASESEGLQLLDVATGAVVHAMVPGERGKPQGSGNTAYSAAVSPDGKLIVSGHRDGGVMLWDTATGKLLATEHVHHDVVTNAAFSPDGTSIATGDQVGQIWLWKLSDVWRIPPDFKSEVIPFPLDFAPQLAHRGAEELRFPPGMFDPKAPGYWSYAFTWRTEDAAALGADQLAAELTTYFRGLVTAVDDKHRIASTADIAAHAKPNGDGFDLQIHSYDAFATAQPIELVGHARRLACGSGALWVFVVAREGAALRAELDALAAEARC